MKKFLLLLIPFLFIGIGNLEASVCSPGTQVTDTVTVDGCDYEVDLCVYCDVTYPGYIRVNSFQNIGGCSTTLTSDEITDQITSQLSTWGQFWVDYCQVNLPPCTGTAREQLSFKIATCWKVKLIEDNGFKDANVYLYLPCDDAYCVVTYDYCIDANGDIIKSFDSATAYNFPVTCDTEGKDIHYPLGTVGLESGCYVLYTVCNPEE